MRSFLWLLASMMCPCLLGQASAESLGSRYILSAVEEAKRTVDEAYKYSRDESLARVQTNTVSAANRLRLMRQPCGDMRSAVRAADYMENALRIIEEKAHFDPHTHSLNATDLLTAEDLNTIARLTGCSARIQAPSCRSTPLINKYRTTSSVCNNRRNPRLGASNTPFVRWLPAEYQDGIALPRGWDRLQRVNGYLLPLVREVSNRIFKTTNDDVTDDNMYTHLITIFGQWTDHDLTFTPHSPSIRSFSSGINCEDSCEGSEPCFPIPIPEDDPRFARNSEACMPFTRSAPGCGTGYTGSVFGMTNVRQQMNALTAFLDVGQVYGATDAQARDLRDLTNDEGLLRVNDLFTDNGRELLPFSSMPVNMCATRNAILNTTGLEEVPCFLAGDARGDENIALTSLHTLMMREHNRLAQKLGQLNPHWSSETLYQEARKIMGGYAQVVTYRDYLPFIVGPDMKSQHFSTYPGYDENVDPSIANVFATAAFRFAHLQVQPVISRLDEDYNDHPEFPSVLLHRAFFAPWRVILEGGVDPLLRGLVGRRAKLNKQDMHDELRDRLFQFISRLALDLASLNIQRGRDHGLPGYNAWRGYYGLSQPQTEQELAAVLNSSHLAGQLMELYGTADNIDVWLGGIAEPSVPGGRVGPLFARIIADQFQRIRLGDRLWWEKDGVFTSAQRDSLACSSIARIICDNTSITEVPVNPFLYRPRGQGYTDCENIPEFDLSPWQENGSSDMGWNSIGSQGPPGPPGPVGPQGPAGPPGSSTRRNSAFAVRLGYNSLNPGLDRRIVFRDAIYNELGHYSTETGIFTCVVPGTYQFDFHCTFDQNVGNIDLRRNGVPVLRPVTSRQSGYIAVSHGTILKLNEGDQVWLQASYGGTRLNTESYFLGHLLFEA